MAGSLRSARTIRSSLPWVRRHKLVVLHNIRRFHEELQVESPASISPYAGTDLLATPSDGYSRPGWESDCCGGRAWLLTLGCRGTGLCLGGLAFVAEVAAKVESTPEQLSARDITTKLQIPTSKHQSRTKLQAPKQARVRPGLLDVENWCFSECWSLVLGASFVLGV